MKDILGGGKSKSPSRQQPTKRPTQHRHPQKPKTIGEQARSLEDLLNVSRDHHAQQRQAAPAPRKAPRPPAPPQRTPEQESLNEQSAVLVRAMINAAKSDGQIDKSEQQVILKQLDHVTQDEVDFLQQEFAKPLDVREFAWSVPLGLEEQVYGISVLAIDLDENKEANYLGELAHGLRLSPKKCNEIHRQFEAPEIFQV